MVFNSIGVTPEKLKIHAGQGAVTVNFRGCFETAVPGVVNGCDPRGFSKVQRRWPIARKYFDRTDKALNRELWRCAAVCPTFSRLGNTQLSKGYAG
jgi:hypothetical protein